MNDNPYQTPSQTKQITIRLSSDRQRRWVAVAFAGGGLLFAGLHLAPFIFQAPNIGWRAISLGSLPILAVPISAIAALVVLTFNQSGGSKLALPISLLPSALASTWVLLMTYFEVKYVPQWSYFYVTLVLSRAMMFCAAWIYFLASALTVASVHPTLFESPDSQSSG